MKTSLFLGTAISAMLATGIAAAAPANYHVDDISSEHELPAGASSAGITGKADFTIDTAAHTICGKVTVSPAATVLTAMHFHTGDDTVASGPVILNLPDTYGATPGEIDINFSNVPEAVITSIANEATYLNLHTEAFANGAARDQLAAGGDGATCVGTPTDLGDAGAPATTADAGSTSSSSSSGSVSTTAPDGGTAASAGDTSDSGGCSTTGSSTTDTFAFLAGLGLVVAAVSRKRKKA